MANVTIYWRGPCAYLNWRSAGKRFRCSLGRVSREEAERVRGQKEAELIHGVRIIARLPTVKKYLDEDQASYAATHPTTASKYKSEVKRFIASFGHRAIDTLRREEMNKYVRDRLVDDKASPETVGKEVRRLKAAFRRGVRDGLIDFNPMDGVRAPKGVRSVAVRFYEKKDLAKLYKANRSRASLWQFMAHTGIRRGEMVKLRPKEDVRRGNLIIESIPDETGAGRTKSGKWRQVPLNAKAKAALAKLPDPPVTVHPDTLTDWFAEDAKKAGIGGSLHRLRHTFGANLTMAGVPLRRVQELMGHADYATTEKYYAHLTPEGAGTAVKLLEKLL